MKISTRRVDGIMIFDVSGRIVLGEGNLLWEAISTALLNREKKLLLNLAHVNYMDSAGIGELISAHINVKKHGGQLQLLNLTNKVQHVLRITKLYTVLDINDDETEAIASVNGTIETAQDVVAI